MALPEAVETPALVYQCSRTPAQLFAPQTQGIQHQAGRGARAQPSSTPASFTTSGKGRDLDLKRKRVTASVPK